MKKTISIFFLLLFFVFQYGRILDYLECRIAATVTSTPDCGCETKLVAAADTGTPAPLHQHSLKNYTEEFFDDEKSEIPVLNFINTQDHIIHFLRAKPIGYSNSIFQPPRTKYTVFI